MKLPKQVAAIPYRIDARGNVKVLLVTSRGTRRWVVPKGWPWPKHSNHEAARGEAWEEAGVIGVARKGRIGSYVYEKREGARSKPVKVLVYLLEVSSLARNWPEFGERRRAWFAPMRAAQAVDEPELKALLGSIETLLGLHRPLSRASG